MNKTLALAAIAGLSMASEIDGFADENLAIFNLENSIKRPIFTKLHTVDDEFRVLPIVDHPRPSGPAKPIWTDDADDEFRILPIVDHPRPSGPSKPIRADDADDEFRILPIVDHPRPSGPAKPIRADDADDADDELSYYGSSGEGWRIHPIENMHNNGRGQGRGRNPRYPAYKPKRPEITYTDDELAYVSTTPYYGNGRIQLAGDFYKINPNQKPRTMMADDVDDELVYASTTPYYGNGRIQLAGNVHKINPNQKPRTMIADDELRTIPSLYSYMLNKHGKDTAKDTAKKPIIEEIANDDEYHVLESRLISVGAGSLARPKRNTTETAKPLVKPTQDARLIAVGAGSLTRPKRNATETAKPKLQPKPLSEIPIQAADDSLVELSHLLKDLNKKGFLA